MKNKTFTKKDLKVGYIVVCNGAPHMVMVTANNHTVLVDSHGFLSLDGLSDDLRDSSPKIGGDWTVTEVYGYSASYAGACAISTYSRELLWKREEPAKKMTVEEIEKALGYKVEIVS